MSVTFKRVETTNEVTTTKDTGIIGDRNSIKPVLHNEFITEEVLQRPTNNLRVRSEELARVAESIEYIVQSATNSSKILRYLVGANSLPGLLKVYSQTFNTTEKVYYFSPHVPEGTTGTSPSLLVLGSATNSFSYIVNQAAIEAFYNLGASGEQHNRYVGLSSVGDSICLRIPTVSSTYTSETLLPRTTSSLQPAGEAVIDADLATALTSDFISANDATYSLIKIPAKNSIKIIPQEQTLIDFLALQALKTNEDKTGQPSLFIQGFGATNSEKIPLDLNGIVDLGSNEFRLPKAGYRDFEELSTSYASFGFFIGTSDASAIETVTIGSSFSFPEETMLPKNEYLYPLAVFSGDAVLFPGLGGVSLIDLQTRDGEAFIDGAGVVIGETGTATEMYNTRCRITYENASTLRSTSPSGIKDFIIPSTDGGFEYLRVPIDTLVTEAGTGSALHLTKLSMQVTLDEEFAVSTDSITSSQLRDVYISIGMFDIEGERDTYESTSGAKFSLLTCVPSIPSNSQFLSSAVPRLILSNFKLRDLEDDYYAEIKLTDSVRTRIATTGETRLIVWIYRLDGNKGQFFTTADSGSFNLEFNMEFSSRLGDNVNLGTTSDLENYLS